MTNNTNTDDGTDGDDPYPQHSSGDPEDRPVIDFSDAKSTNWMAASRKNRVLGDDKEEAEQTAWSMASHIVNRAEDEYGDTPATIPNSFKKHLIDGFVAPVIADIIADRLVADHGDKLSDDEQRRVRRLGGKAVINAADARTDDDERDERHRGRFEDMDLATVDHGPLSDGGQWEYIREKARRIRERRGWD